MNTEQAYGAALTEALGLVEGSRSESRSESKQGGAYIGETTPIARCPQSLIRELHLELKTCQYMEQYPVYFTEKKNVLKSTLNFNCKTTSTKNQIHCLFKKSICVLLVIK